MLVIKKGRDQQSLKNREVESAVVQFVELKSQIDELSLTLKIHKDTIVSYALECVKDEETSTITFGVDDDFVKVGFGFDVSVADDAKLMTLLGERFNDLVKTQIVYKPEARLKSMALDDDGLKECLNIKEKTPTVAVVK